MNCGQDFKNKYCVNLSDIDCNHKCDMEKNQQAKIRKQNQVDRILNYYNRELRRNVSLKNSYSALTSEKNRGGMSMYGRYRAESRLRRMRSELIRSNYRLAQYLENMREIVKDNENLIDRKDKLISSKDNEIEQKNIRIRRINNQINNLQDEFLSNQQKIHTGIERNQYKRNVIIIMVVLVVLLSAGMAYLLIKK